MPDTPPGFPIVTPRKTATLAEARTPTMDILIADIPEEGLHLEGEFPASIFALDPEDSIRPCGPVRYAIDVHAFDDVLSLEGTLRGPFQLQCNTCLEYFDFDADFTDWGTDLELEDGQRSFNLRELVREEFLFELPSHPRCDEFGSRACCPKAEYLTEDPGTEDSDPEGEPPSDTAWDALDQIE